MLASLPSGLFVIFTNVVPFSTLVDLTVSTEFIGPSVPSVLYSQVEPTCMGQRSMPGGEAGAVESARVAAQETRNAKKGNCLFMVCSPFVSRTALLPARRRKAPVRSY